MRILLLIGVILMSVGQVGIAGEDSLPVSDQETSVPLPPSDNPWEAFGLQMDNHDDSLVIDSVSGHEKLTQVSKIVAGASIVQVMRIEVLQNQNISRRKFEIRSRVRLKRVLKGVFADEPRLMFIVEDKRGIRHGVQLTKLHLLPKD